MANEAIQGAPYPLPSDPPAAEDIKALADWAAPRIPMRFASMTALTATVTAPFAGQMAVTTDYGVLWSWTGARWAPVGTPRFASTAALLAAIASPAVGDAAMVGSDEYRCLTARSWKLWARPETSWTPATTGIPVKVNAATYCVQAGRVVGDLRLTATGAATGSITFNPPLTYDITRYTPMGDAVLFDASASTRRVWRTYGGFSDTQQYAVITEGTTATLANATNPWTWATGDKIDIHFSYRPTDAALSI